MVLEATIICLDSSEWMRNGDYSPTRLEAQTDAVNLLMNWKLNANPENTVGILKMAKGPEVLVTPTTDVGKILSALHTIKVAGKIDLMTSIQVAQLALKHRQNKNQHQRMIVLVGSPIQADTQALVKLGASLKKNNVAVDVVSFGEVEENAASLEAFIKAVNSNDNSHLVEVVPGTRSLTEAIRASPLSGSPRSAGGGASGGEGEEFLDFNPNDEPELMMAIRESLEEERRRKEKEKTEGGQPTTTTKEAEMTEATDLPEDEEAMLAKAIELSMQAAAPQANPPQPSLGKETSSTPAPSQPESKPLSEEDEMARAMELSMGSQKTEGDVTAIGDADFLNSVLKTLPGVDPEDPQIKSILEGLKGEKKDDKKDDQEDKDKTGTS